MSRTRSADDSSVLVQRTAGLTAVLGAFVMVSTVIFTITDFMGIQNVLVGAAVAFLAAFQAYRTNERRSPSIVIAAVVAVLGIWIVAAPFVLGADRALVVGVNGVAGVLIVILSLAGAYGSRQLSTAASAST